MLFGIFSLTLPYFTVARPQVFDPIPIKPLKGKNPWSSHAKYAKNDTGFHEEIVLQLKWQSVYKLKI